MILKYIRKMKENKEITLISGLMALNLLNIVHNYWVAKQSSHYIQRSPYTSIEPVKRDFCYQSFKSILDKKAHSHMVSGKIKKALVLSNYSALELKSREVIRHVFSTTKGCKIITSDSSKLRQFDLILEENENNPFFYLLTQIHEEDIQEEV